MIKELEAWVNEDPGLRVAKVEIDGEMDKKDYRQKAVAKIWMCDIREGVSGMVETIAGFETLRANKKAERHELYEKLKEEFENE